jgi:hypothetical protein
MRLFQAVCKTPSLCTSEQKEARNDEFLVSPRHDAALDGSG